MHDKLSVAAGYQLAEDVAEVFRDLLVRQLKRFVSSIVENFDERRY